MLYRQYLAGKAAPIASSLSLSVCVSHLLLQFAFCLIWLDNVIALELLCATTYIPHWADISSTVPRLSGLTANMVTLPCITDYCVPVQPYRVLRMCMLPC